jgi:hypothetical protein
MYPVGQVVMGFTGQASPGFQPSKAIGGGAAKTFGATANSSPVNNARDIMNLQEFLVVCYAPDRDKTTARD